YFLSKTIAGNAGEVIKLSQSANNEASSQITLESEDRIKTKKGLLEGLTHGLAEDKTDVNRKMELRSPDAEITATVSTAAARLNLPAVDTGLIMAYVVADLSHKAMTLLGGGAWGNAASNFKSWRTLFPKSHPSQIVLQSMDALPTLTDLTSIRNQ